MKMRMKLFTDSMVAKLLLCFSSCHTITLGWMVFSKRSEWQLSSHTVNHESIHVKQWSETTAASVPLLSLLCLSGLLSWWWMLAAPLVYYLWYFVEWLVRLVMYRDLDMAYRNISMEKEAYRNEYDAEYGGFAPFMSWMEYL